MGPSLGGWSIRFPKKANRERLEPAGCALWLGNLRCLSVFLGSIVLHLFVRFYVNAVSFWMLQLCNISWSQEHRVQAMLFTCQLPPSPPPTPHAPIRGLWTVPPLSAVPLVLKHSRKSPSSLLFSVAPGTLSMPGPVSALGFTKKKKTKKPSSLCQSSEKLEY